MFHDLKTLSHEIAVSEHNHLEWKTFQSLMKVASVSHDKRQQYQFQIKESESPASFWFQQPIIPHFDIQPNFGAYWSVPRKSLHQRHNYSQFSTFYHLLREIIAVFTISGWNEHYTIGGPVVIALTPSKMTVFTFQIQARTLVVSVTAVSTIASSIDAIVLHRTSCHTRKAYR